MKFKFQFNSKSTSLNVPQALKIAEKLNSRIEGKFCVIEFDEPPENLRKLAHLTLDLKGTAFFFQDEPINYYDIRQFVLCDVKLSCNGFCDYRDPFDLKENEEKVINGKIKLTEFELDDEYKKFLIPNADGSNIFRINVDDLIEYLDQKIETKLCNKINLELLRGKLKDINTVEIVEEEEGEEEGRSEYSKLLSLALMILKSVLMSSKLELSAILKLVKLTTLLESNPIGITISSSLENVHYCVSEKSFILTKLIEVEEGDEFNEREEKSEIINKIIESSKIEIKELDHIPFYCLNSPLFSFYFQLFEENELNNISKALLALKSL